jgi:hypothetical protein
LRSADGAGLYQGRLHQQRLGKLLFFGFSWGNRGKEMDCGCQREMRLQSEMSAQIEGKDCWEANYIFLGG